MLEEVVKNTNVCSPHSLTDRWWLERLGQTGVVAAVWRLTLTGSDLRARLPMNDGAHTVMKLLKLAFTACVVCAEDRDHRDLGC